MASFDRLLAKSELESGKHCYCECPLGANTKEAEELAALARRTKLVTMVGLQRRASPAYLYLRELVREGYVGEVLSVNMTLVNSGVLTRTSDRTLDAIALASRTGQRQQKVAL